MTSRAEVLVVISSITELLREHGYPKHADWLDARADDLRNSASEGEARRVLDDLHRVVLGMGGLLDLSLEAPSPAASLAARDTLIPLADRLYDLTR